MNLGTITRSDSQLRYLCQIYGLHEAEVVPEPRDYAFGRFVKVALRSAHQYERSAEQPTELADENILYVVGVICNTVLYNPTAQFAGPRLSNEDQCKVFTPDYLSEQGVVVTLQMLGMMEMQATQGGQFQTVTHMHGIPLAPKQNSVVATMTEKEVWGFHLSGTPGAPVEMGYLTHLLGNPLFPAIALEIIRQLELLIPPPPAAPLGLLKRTLAWRHKVVPIG
jgi:hypothetical protein